MRSLIVLAVSFSLAACGPAVTSSPAPATPSVAVVASPVPTPLPTATVVPESPTPAPSTVPTTPDPTPSAPAVATPAAPTATPSPAPIPSGAFVVPTLGPTLNYVGGGTITRILGPRLIEVDLILGSYSREKGWTTTPVLVRWDENTNRMKGQTVTEFPKRRDGTFGLRVGDDIGLWLLAGSYDPVTGSYYALDLP